MIKKTLHLLRQSPFKQNDISLCCHNVTIHDAIVLIDDGCYTINHQMFTELCNTTQNIFIIEDHVFARGLKMPNCIQAIHLNKFNELIFEYSNSVTWQ
ncbi:sulfurtransferase complex subunit TusB [Colwelliaceae bacterium 6441]